MKGDIVLLGAGASAPDTATSKVGVPIAREMTNAMLDGLEGQPDKVQHAVRLAVSTLMFGFGMRGEDPRNGVNIEDVFNLLETLETRGSLEAAPLIGSWNPVVESLDRILTQPRQRTPSAFESLYRSSSHGKHEAVNNLVRIIMDLKGSGPFAEADLKRSLLKLASEKDDSDVSSLYGRKAASPPTQEPQREVPGRGVIYKNAREYLIGRLKNLVWLEDKDFVSRFNPMLEQARRDLITIATLNYDNGIELAAEHLGIEVDTRMREWENDHRLGIGGFESVLLLKLHGSIDWTLETSPQDDKTLPHCVIRTLKDLRHIKHPDHRPAVIFGGRNKLTVRGPYLELLLDFRQRLFASNRLIVIGYSFGDDHVNEYIAQWFSEKDSRKIVLVCGTSFEPRPNTFADYLVRMVGPRVVNRQENAREGIANLFRP